MPPIDLIKEKGGSLLAEGIERMRGGKVNIQPGYDGVFGKVNVFSPMERTEAKEQMTLFS